MNMKTVKKASEITLTDITISFTTKDGQITGVVFGDCEGRSVTVQNNGWSSGLEVLVPAPPAMVKRWQVSGKLRGISFDETFDEEHKALARMTEIGVEADPCELKTIEIAESA